MVLITPGTGATIAANTAEGQAFQLMNWWQIQEDNPLLNPGGLEYFTGSKGTDTGNKFFEGVWKIPATFTAAAPFTVVPGNPYQGLVFTPGTGGSFTSATATAYTLQVLLWLINRENQPLFNPDNFEYIAGKFDANTGMYEGTFKLPYVTTLLPNGGTQDIARPYLL